MFLNYLPKSKNILLIALLAFGAFLQSCSADSEAEPSKPKPYIYSDDEIYPVVIGDDYLMGYVNDSRQIVIEAQFTNAGEFHEGLAVASKGAQSGYIDRSGQWAIEPQYTYADDFENGMAVAMKLDNPNASDGVEYWNLIDSSGKVKVKTEYFRIGTFSEGLASVWIEYFENRGFIDEKGALIIEGYDDVGSFSEGLAAVRKGDKWGYIDRTGEVVLPFIYEDTFAFYEDRAVVQIGDKWGFIDRHGKKIIAPRYDSVNSFSEGLAPVFVNEKWGYIDKEGQMVIEPAYLEAFPAQHGMMQVSREQIAEYSYIDREGNRVEFKPLPET
ncbi:WG repeat-containing protein [Saccharibacillus sp. CPCC 101409]|uniref:WG repeat-containing protein n=1 Tax=Saccharibacillus sp. CPCC 101409 TaxID=3058041 RepID=UPI0026738453|nr:WG repeat-containing protein [Saccharibacillus sp. CPCC 101409]MDO3413291.1 WG repeat-containing protein [Saccharibacillus sp. CPCC 101409]